MELTYSDYLDKILGGWIGKCAGGAIGARFEGNKSWIEIAPEEMFPEVMPPNDDLDLQILWLKVLEEKGAAITSDDMAQAWLEGCWYPFNEYGIFRQNWQLGIHPPMSGRYANQFWETGEGCPIRSEIWGYAFPGAPDLAAYYASLDGTLDHTEQSVGAEMMLAAMASMAFFVPDVRRLTEMFIHYLPEASPIERMTRAAFDLYDRGVPLRKARERIMLMAGYPEACDSQINIPFTFLGLLYGEGDIVETMLTALRCGYDTDCTLATAAALVGQILGASRIPESIKRAVGEELVMGIQYTRPEMTISALARDTARMGVLLSEQSETGVVIVGAPVFEPLPEVEVTPAISIEYDDLPAAAPGDIVGITVVIEGAKGRVATLAVPEGWTAIPAQFAVDCDSLAKQVLLCADAEATVWPKRHLFKVRVDDCDPYAFGIAGADLWALLGVGYDAVPPEGDIVAEQRRFNQHYISLKREYLAEPVTDIVAKFADMSERLGMPALVPSYEREVDPSVAVGLRGPLVAYLARTVISPDERDVFIGVGNTDGYRLWVNGELVGEANETVWWTPFNGQHAAHFVAGDNEIVLKMMRPRDEVQFTLAIREDNRASDTPFAKGFNAADWCVDLADRVPGK